MTKQMDVGRPLMVLYAAVFENEQDALNVVKNKVSPNEDVEVVGQLAPGTVQALGLVAGQISML
jgi:hypothetical protein